MSNNPYEPVSQIHRNAEPNPANCRRCAAVGFLFAFIPIAAIGAFGLYNEAQYAATLSPNTLRCGNGAMGAMLLIFPVSPMLGCFGAVIGFVSAIVYNALPIGGASNTEDVSQ